jgi:hypothetical protein
MLRDRIRAGVAAWRGFDPDFKDSLSDESPVILEKESTCWPAATRTTLAWPPAPMIAVPADMSSCFIFE